jgi:hypothetical protein
MNNKKSSHILVIGDFMLDQEWILSGLPLPTVQAHSQVKPLQRINPTWNTQRLGGAGMTLMALKTLSETKSLEYNLHGIGLWNEKDESLFQQLAGDEKQIKLHRLKVKSELDSSDIVTTIKSRFYTQLAQERPKLFSRFDQDPEPDPNLPPHESNIFEGDPLQDIKEFFKNKNIQPEDIKAVLVADFNKGVVQKSVLESLKEYLNENTLWFIDSKNPQILETIPDEQRIHVLTMNREEAVRLYNKVSKDQKIFSIPEGRQPGIEILSLIKELSTQKNKQLEKIVIKLDKEGACLYVSQQSEKQSEDENNTFNTFIRQPEKSLESDGIAAGDFFNASFLLSILSEPDDPLNYLHRACIETSQWLKLNQEYWVNKEVRQAYKSDVVKAEFLNSKQPGIKNKINQEKNWDIHDEFNLDLLLETRKTLFNYEMIVEQEDPKIVLADAKGFLGDFASTDPSLRRKIRDFVDRISQYTKAKGKARPLNCLVTAKPGSGKSFFAGQVAEATGCQIIEVNCSQMTSAEDLLESIAQLNDVKDKIPLLFLDEVDTEEKFYPFLLAPLWDASALVKGKTKTWSKRFISILVASDKNFLENLRKNQDNKGNPIKKSADLLSRLNGPRLTLSEPDLSEKKKNERQQILTSRVYLAADTLLRYHDTARIIECGILDLVYCATEFNPRSLEHFIASIPTPTDGIVSLKNISEERLKEFAESLGYTFADGMNFEVPKGQANLSYRYKNPEALKSLPELSTERIRLIQKS